VPDRIVVPEDLSQLDDAALAELERQVVERFDTLDADDDVSGEVLAEMGELADGLDRIRATQTERTQAAQAQAAQREELQRRVRGQQDDDTDDDEPADEPAEGEGAEGAEPQARPAGDLQPVAADQTAVIAAAVTAAMAPVVEALAARVPGLQVREPAPLAAARAHQPPQPTPPRRLQVHAGADIPRVPRGGLLENLDQLGAALRERAKSMPTTHTKTPGGWLQYDQVPGAIVASIGQDHLDHVIDGERTSPAEVEELWHELVNPDAAEALLAAGGWCSPSETRYDFYNVVCTDGLLDLPSFGVNRGGVKYPVSPSYADIFAAQLPGGVMTSSTVPWVWSETDDIAAVTGAPPSKGCVRAPCPSFTDVRLEAHGICVTAGNLTDDAYPEATANFLRYLLSVFEHAQNARYMAQLLALSSAVVTGGPAAGTAISIDLPAAVEWAGIDYRTKFGMCDRDVLEAIFPFWIKAPIRTDIAGRTGREAVDVSDAEVNRLFTSRGIRPQFVKDWQVRGANQPGGATAARLYPAAVDWLLYSAGTFMRGNGMTLDLGVVRDSLLNKSNDFTAAWMEETHLVARFGHESRLYRTDICAAGNTGAANIVDCRSA
jgi:hypothetical protein